MHDEDDDDVVNFVMGRGGVIIGHSVFTDMGRGDNRSFCIYRWGRG